ncbi:hypothetical protein IQ257_23775 [Coleofasciculus sp. LEGE 07092]|nr:hypothetical protein [Coleofasciculus sp. LEGE 07081]MBE9151450.1 hypothetical protein [Coleofasciculus sp. LEGE 07092]
MIPVGFLLFGGGLVACGNLNQLGTSSITIGDWAVDVTPIGTIQPDRNTAAIVYLQGKVTHQAPFLAAGAYQLQDATGKIWVITNQVLPQVGDEISLKGQLQFQSIPVSGQELGEVYVQEQERVGSNAGKTESPASPAES